MPNCETARGQSHCQSKPMNSLVLKTQWFSQRLQRPVLKKDVIPRRWKQRTEPLNGPSRKAIPRWLGLLNCRLRSIKPTSHYGRQMNSFPCLKEVSFLSSLYLTYG